MEINGIRYVEFNYDISVSDAKAVKKIYDEISKFEGIITDCIYKPHFFYSSLKMKFYIPEDKTALYSQA